MPEIDLTDVVPPTARWIKVQFEMKPRSPEARLLARLWSGALDDAVVIKGTSGQAFVKINRPQKLSYQRPVNVDLKLKVIAYKTADE